MKRVFSVGVRVGTDTAALGPRGDTGGLCSRRRFRLRDKRLPLSPRFKKTHRRRGGGDTFAISVVFYLASCVLLLILLVVNG